MFDLDIRLFNFVYSNCKVLGSSFGYGAFEGFIMYSSIILLAIVKAKENSSKRVKK